ncbi:hypothetical protein [Candidatus Colwellia aromaticivorans]|uniref:hypothetical protein n=1 Tax=Candidatus Colwellia aromaticivorans TaxID=2267621 RepID=UPI000DF23994|nr:hypothetical protein [Candidatus Colwellia aromaticivorans]
MNKYIKLSLGFSPLLLSACVNQNTIAQNKLAPVTNPCQKISMLINAYDDGFEQVKMTKIKARVSNTWKAKYNVIGENCHIWTWGNSQTTYACNITANDKDTAENYYTNAQRTIQQCLGSDWQMTEEQRTADKGRKSIFTTPNKQVSLSTHIIPLDSLFGEKWTIYYYIGNPN